MYMELHTIDGKVVMVNLAMFTHVVENSDGTFTIHFVHDSTIVVKEGPQFIKDEIVKIINQARLLGRQ